MSVALGTSDAFDLMGWRDGLRERRKLVQRVVLLVQLRGGHALEATLAEVKQALDYEAMPQKDRNLVRTTFKDIRTIVRGWPNLTDKEKQDFHDGQVAPSMIAKRLRSSANEASPA